MDSVELELYDPTTGEIIDATDMPKVGEVISNIRTLKQKLNNALDELTEAVVEESKRVGSKTMRYGTIGLELSPDHEIQWDVEELGKLVAEGLPSDRWNQLLTTTISFKVDARVAKQIASSNSVYAHIIENAQQKFPKKQYVKITRT